MASPKRKTDSRLLSSLASKIGWAIFLGVGYALVLACAGVIFVVFFPLILLWFVFMGPMLCWSVISNYRRRLRGLGRRTIEHPLFGTLRFDESMDAWTGAIRLPVFAEYDTAAQPAWLDSPTPEDEAGGRPPDEEMEEDEEDALFRQGKFRLWIASRTGHEPSAEQEEAYRYLEGSEEKVLEAIIQETFSTYQDCIDDWRDDLALDSEDAERLMPRLDSPEGFKRLMCLRSVEISETAEDGIAETEFHFDCTWDEEHGWPVITHKDRVVG